jgi:hypothetical protein
MDERIELALPVWVPVSARRYLAHTEQGRSIRELARGAGCHASTVLRQIRQVELRRDDPLVDAGLSALATAHFPPSPGSASAAFRAGANTRKAARMTVPDRCTDPTPNAETIEREAIGVLHRLCESGAVLAVAENMEKAVVVRDCKDGRNIRTAVVDAAIAQAMALKDWIACAAPGRISRYRITAAGRAELARLVARHENRARTTNDTGFAEAQTPFDRPVGTGSDATEEYSQAQMPRRHRYSAAESPVALLARRKDRDGQPFLSLDLVSAGERLREDFELAQIGPSVAQNWDRFLTGGGRSGGAPDSGAGQGHCGARDSVARALADLGPGLSDVVLRCCCFQEGLEIAEKRLGWSARSGKIVLRIALQRLKRHYDALSVQDQMIG